MLRLVADARRKPAGAAPVRAACILALALAGCGGSDAELSDAELRNRAEAIARAADETVNAQIAEIVEQSKADAAEDSSLPPPAAENAAGDEGNGAGE